MKKATPKKAEKKRARSSGDVTTSSGEKDEEKIISKKQKNLSKGEESELVFINFFIFNILIGNFN